MERRLLAVVSGAVCFSLCVGVLPAQTPPSSSIKIAYWNIKWFPGGRPNAYPREEAKQIRAVHHDIQSLGADIIGLEEVRDFANAQLAVQPLPGFKVDVCSNFPPRAGQTDTQQVAITSRLPPMSAWAENWNSGGTIVPPRGFAFAAYQLSARRMLLVYAVHLKSNLGEMVENAAIREESIRQLLAHMKAMHEAYGKLGEITWVVGGDFNTAPDDARFKSDQTIAHLMNIGFRWAWANIPLAERLTMQQDKRYPVGSFDHIFFRGAALTHAEVLPTSAHASDHRAIRAELTLD